MKNKYLILILLMTIFLQSCNKFLDVNTDPDNPSSVPIESALPAAELELAGGIGGSFGVLGGIWSQHYTQNNGSSQYATEDAYALTNGDYNRVWVSAYAALNNLEKIKKQAVTNNDWNSHLIAVCLQSYGFQILADFFDKIPYTEALNTSISSPKYDDGSAIYDQLILNLKDALSKDFSLTTNTHPTTDFIFQGDNERWQQFAKTMILKLTLRRSKVDPNITTNLQSVLDSYDGQFLSDNAAITQYQDQPNRYNPLYESDKYSLNTTNNLNASFTLISFLETHGDIDRIHELFTPNSNGDYVGGIQGNVNIPVSAEKRAIAKISPTQPFYFFGKDEVSFMLAEVRERLGQDGSTDYNNGVTAAFEKLGLDGSSFIATGGQYEYPTAGTFNDKLKAIITQKWVSHVIQGWESFFDQNRTGIPKISTVPADNVAYIPGDFTFSVTGVTSGLFPKRLLFPLIEVQNNNNTPSQVALTTPVWWAN